MTILNKKLIQTASQIASIIFIYTNPLNLNIFDIILILRTMLDTDSFILNFETGNLASYQFLRFFKNSKRQTHIHLFVFIEKIYAQVYIVRTFV